MLFLMYQNKRGGRVVLQDIKCPARHEWGSAEEAMNAALKLERDVNEVGHVSSHIQNLI